MKMIVLLNQLQNGPALSHCHEGYKYLLETMSCIIYYYSNMKMFYRTETSCM